MFMPSIYTSLPPPPPQAVARLSRSSFTYTNGCVLAACKSSCLCCYGNGPDHLNHFITRLWSLSTAYFLWPSELFMPLSLFGFCRDV
ncbi:hypothetical protein J6590_043614 [Homalodisca vitripennis]|nr:hypothetical protein J6590_043614 [Homalodisca vitripennis]